MWLTVRGECPGVQLGESMCSAESSGLLAWRWWSRDETYGLLVCEPDFENLITEAPLLKRSEYTIKVAAVKKLGRELMGRNCPQ